MNRARRRMLPGSSFAFNFPTLWLASIALAMLAFVPCAWAQTATTTTLVLSPSGSTLPPRTPLTLTATVLAGATPVHPGSVIFCDATATLCSGLAVVGTAQLQTNGTAVLHIVPGPESHSYKAVFSGTTTYATSSSTGQTATVSLSPSYETTTKIASSGSAPNYTLTATVEAFGVPPPALTGTVSFLDTTNGNLLLGTAPLGPAVVASGVSDAFGSPVSTGANTAPEGLVTADFNNDGIPDMAAGNGQGSNYVTVLLGNGDGTYRAAPSPATVGNAPIGLATGDFNADGIVDMAVVDFLDNTMYILLGNGDGTFHAAAGSPIALNRQPHAVVVGDFNQDGNLDLAAVEHNPATGNKQGIVAIYLGNGDGTFTAQPTIAVGLYPESLSVGHFTASGHADLAVSNNNSNSITILLGNGDGTFTAAAGSPLAVGSGPRSVTVAELTGDGIQDLAVADQNDNNIRILKGNGDGTFTSLGNIAVGTSPIDIATGDFLGRGRVDLAVANSGSSSLSLLLGNGDGTFTSAAGSPFPVGAGVISVVTGDFNADGVTGLATANKSASSLSILQNQITQTSTATLTGVSVQGGGTHDVDASFPADPNFNGSISSTTPLIATPIATTLALTASPTASTYGQQVLLTATLSPTLVGTLKADGETVTFLNGATVLGTGTLASGVATLNITTLPVGTDPLTVVYAGDSNFLTSTSPVLNYVVSKVPTSTTTLSVAPTTVMYGNTAQLSASVTGPITIATPTGTVSFYEGTTLLGTASLDGTSTAALPINSLNVGVHTITATYNGDTNFPVSTSAGAQLTVTQRTGPDGGAALTVIANDASRTTIQPNPAFSNTITGTLVSGDTYATAVTGTAVYSTAAGTIAGTFDILVSGLASSNYTLAFVPGTLTVVPAPTTTAVATAPSAPQYGDPVTLTAMVISSAATGTVSFFDGSAYLGQGTVSGGVATLITTTLSAGTHTVTAIYNGDATYASSQSAPASLTIAKKTAPDGGPALTVTVQNASREYGTSDPQFANVVSGTLINGDTYDSAVTGIPIYTVADTPGSPVGSTYPITVHGLVSPNYVVSFVPGILTIVTAPTSTTLAASATSTQYGDPLTLTASVAPAGATGTVVFGGGSRVLGTGTVSGGAATWTSTMLNAGTYIITATYEGDSNYGASTSSPVTATVAQRTAPGGGAALTVTANDAARPFGHGNPEFSSTATGTLVNGDTFTTALRGVPVYTTPARVISPVGTYPISHAGGLSSRNYTVAFVDGTLTVTPGNPLVVVSSSSNPSIEGLPVTLTAFVSAAAIGTVTFMDGTAVLATATVSGITATFSTAALAIGTHPITAVYSGNSNYNSATSAVLSQVVVPPDFALSTTPPSQIIPPGASVNYSVTLSSVSAPFNHPIALTATGLPPEATYTFSPATVTPGAAGANATLTITVPGPTASGQARTKNSSPGKSPLILAFLLLPIAALPRIRRKPFRLLSLLALVILGTIVGCGAGGYFAQTQQTYTITVTGTSGSLSHSTTVTLTVQ